MPETLLTPSSIKLFGRAMTSLTYTDDTRPFGNNNFLQRQLSQKIAPLTVLAVEITIDGEVSLAAPAETLPGMLVTGAGISPNTFIIPPRKAESFSISQNPPSVLRNVTLTLTLFPLFARIYAFSFEGALYSLPKPALFLVLGYGTHINAEQWKGDRSSLDQSGVVAREWEFAGSNDLVYWEYEKGDFSLRLDTEAGPFEQILLAASLRSGADRADRSGAGAEVRSGAGAEVRSGAGAEVRSRR